MNRIIRGRGRQKAFVISVLLCFGALLFGTVRGWGQAKPAAPQKTSSTTQKPPAAAPQKPPANAAQDAGQQPPPIRLTVQRVNVPFVVVDEKNRYVTDLNKADFTVYENGKKVPIDFFAPVTTLPLAVGLLLDTSNSIRLQFKPEQEAAIDFVHTLLPERTRHRAFLMTFDSTREMVKDFTNDPNELADAIRKLKPGGGTSLYDAILHSCIDVLIKETRPDDVRRVLVMITDGEDNASRYTMEETIRAARQAQVSIYGINTTSYNQASPGGAVMQKLAEETGGYVVSPWKKPPSADFGTGYVSRHQIGDQNAVYEVGLGEYAGEMAKNLATALMQVHKELTIQYIIGYRPPNANGDGRFREIKVTTKNHSYKVRARKGYFADSGG